MAKSEMVAKIGAGVRLQTLSQGIGFDLQVEEFGLVFMPATGKMRRTPWDGKQWNWRTSVPELFDEWVAAGMPTKARWLRDLAVKRGALSSYWNASYLLATFDFLAD